ncbi:hypothetical protein V8F20_012554 [Naviculisporaceae sp. PSN 640]
MPNMAAGTSFKLVALLSLFSIGAYAQSSQSLLQVLRQGGFTDWAKVLESAQGADILGYPGNLIIYAPTNAGLARQELESGNTIQRRLELGDIGVNYAAIPWSFTHGSAKRSDSTCSQDLPGPGVVDLMTLLNDPEFVNLPAGQNASIVQKNMPKGTLPLVFTGLGDSVRVVGQDIPFDKGIIRPISGWFTLPKPLSTTLPFIGANKVLDVLERTALIKEFDNRPGITFLAPADQAIPANISDDALVEMLRRHVIVGTPKFSSDISYGDSLETLAGIKVPVKMHCGDVFIDRAKILSGDTVVKNGVVHVVDRLIEAPQLATTTLFQTVTITATETAKVVETSVETTTETMVETVGGVVTSTETVEIPVADATTATETVTVNQPGTLTVEVSVPGATTTTETVTIDQPSTQTVEVTLPSTTTTTTTVTVNIPSTEPPPSSIERPPTLSSSATISSQPPPPPPPSYPSSPQTPPSSTSPPPTPVSSFPPPSQPLLSLSVSTPPPPPLSSTTSTSPPPRVSSSAVSSRPPPVSSFTPPVTSSLSSSTPPPAISSSLSSTPPHSSSSSVSSETPCSSSVSTPVPPSTSTVPSSAIESRTTPCPESETSSAAPTYPSGYPVSIPSSPSSSSDIPPASSAPPAYPSYPAYPTYPVYEPSSSIVSSEPSSTPCDESSTPPVPVYPTTLVTSQRPNNSPAPPEPSLF